MTRFNCPHCQGGFDLPGGSEEDPQCPWCGTAIDGGYDPEEHTPAISTLRRSEDGEEDRPEMLLERIKRAFN